MHMGFQCCPQIMGLQRQGHVTKSNKRGAGKFICAEMGEERISSSDIIRREDSQHNIYTNYIDGQDFISGFKLWDYIEKQGDNRPVRCIDKKTGEEVTRYRKSKADAVLGYAYIIKPPVEVTETWTVEQKIQFYEDSFDAMCEIMPEVFSRENRLFTAVHVDEGFTLDDEHVHGAGIPRDSDGNYTGNLIDTKHLSLMQNEFPRHMRKKGWDIEDNDVTDWHKYNTDKQYHDERKAHIEQKKKDGKGGLSPNEYRRFLTQKNLRESHEILEDAKTELNRAILTRHETLELKKHFDEELDVRADKKAKKLVQEKAEQLDREFEHKVTARAKEIIAPVEEKCERAHQDYVDKIAGIDKAIEEQMALYVLEQKDDDSPEMKRMKQFLSHMRYKDGSTGWDKYNEYAKTHSLDRTERIRRDSQRLADNVRDTDWSGYQRQVGL